MDDEGDFKKARGFLLTYSALVLALWYFGADLTQFKLMGNEVRLQHRTDSAWLVLAVLNIYFLARCYQRMPSLGLYLDGPMNDLYDKSLVWVALKFKLRRKALRAQAAERFAKTHDQSRKMQITSYDAITTVQHDVGEAQRRNGDEAPDLHQLSRSSRAEIKISLLYAIYEKNGQPLDYPGGEQLTFSPHVLITWAVKAFAIGRGAFITPWFTDHVAPLALGLLSTSLALLKWCEMKFFTDVFSASVLLCF